MSQLDTFVLDANHRKRLRWFEERAGDTSGYPKPLPDGQFLVSAPKGIYKPQDLPYALSVRVNLQSKYNDGQRIDRSDGSWAFAYHQENPDIDARDREYTNQALLKCVADSVPVGVLFEREPVKGKSQYEILGLALPVGWSEGYFFFEGFGPQGPARNADTRADVLLGSALAGDSGGVAGGDTDVADPPSDDYDARLKALRQIVARRGQQQFRRQLLDLYSGQCAVSGEGVPQVLDAAHIRPYRGPDSNTPKNGLLLRTDLHSLLDLQLIAIEPATRTLVVSKTLHASTYMSLQGTALSEPSNLGFRPAGSVLAYAWTQFLEAEAMRPDPHE